MEIGIRDLRDGLGKHLAEVRQGRTSGVTDQEGATCSTRWGRTPR